MHYLLIAITTIAMQAFSSKAPVLEKHPYNAEMQPGPKPVREQPFFGKQLSFYRQKQGLTQQELADELEISRDLVGHYERRCESPSIDFIIKVAQVFGITTDELLGLKTGKEKPGPSPKALKVAQRISKLPKPKQTMILSMLEGALDKAS